MFKDARAQKLFGHYPPMLISDFKQYHKANPHIYERFRQLAIRMQRTGREYYSSKMLINVIRWETDLRSNDPNDKQFKINDKFQSLYGRLLAYHEPSFEQFFRFRYRQK